MKLRLLSDLHAECWDENYKKAISKIEREILPPLDGDENTVLILAGDICTAKREKMFHALFTHFSSRFKNVILIPGNHEAYGRDLLLSAIEIADWVKEFSNIIYTSDRFEIDGNGFNTCTLWTDFDKENPETMVAAQFGMNDYRLIRWGEEALNPEVVLGLHKSQREKLVEQMQEGDIIITHHAPSERSIHPEYKDHFLNACYFSNLEDIIRTRKPALWCHGHVHHAQDYMIGNTRILCNPYGYNGRENTGYKNKMVIEVVDENT